MNLSGLRRLLLAIGLMAVSAAPFAVFDPVNDDSDLFRNNPNIPAQRPNVLIIIDNTANWSSAFANEKAALISVVNGLDSSFNVGLMYFTGSGGANDGAAVRFGVRQMTPTNKSRLAQMLTDFANDPMASGAGDKANNGPTGLAMAEAYLYFTGKDSHAGYTEALRDYNGSSVNIAGNLAGNPLSSVSQRTYTKAITQDCQKNYIIYISNGSSNENSSARSAGETLLAAAGYPTSSIIQLSATANFFQSNWSDEWAKFMAENDLDGVSSNGKQTVITYTIEVDPASNNSHPADWTALMTSMALNGKGKPLTVTSGGSGATIVAALNSIFQEIQAVNSVFAASTLPVSVNVRGTNLNQLYIGVFRPDAADQPRWLGNLKAYQLKKDPITGTVFTVDKNLNPAINSTTGFITSSAVSFWSSSTKAPTNYWSFRLASENGVGGSSDSPDGDLVEKGGAGQQVRSLYFTNGVNGTPTRPLYTCTQGGTFPICAPGTLLSATPFSTANTDITAASLNLGSRNVSPLTGAQSKTVTALADTRAVQLNNALAPKNVSSITTNAISQSGVTLLNTSSTTLSGNRPDGNPKLYNAAVAIAYTGITTPSNDIQVATTAGLSNGTGVITTGTGSTTEGFVTCLSSVTGPCSSVAINSSGSSSFRYTRVNNLTSVSTGLTITTSNTKASVYLPSHGFVEGQRIVISGAPVNSWLNGVQYVRLIAGDSNNFEFYTAATSATSNSGVVSTGPGAGPWTIVASSATVSVTLPAAAALGTFQVGQLVVISGETATASDTVKFNGTFTILSTTVNGSGQTTAFTYSTGSAITKTAAGTIVATQSGTTATVNATAHGFLNGNSVELSCANPTAYNATYSGAAAVANATLNSFQITVPAGLGNPVAATGCTSIQADVPGATGTLVTATLAGHGFLTTAPNNAITISGVTAAGWNGNYTVTAVVGDTFVFSTASALAVADGNPQVRLTANPKAYATIPAHGYGADLASVPNLTIAGAVPNGYNGTVTATVVDTDTISYGLTAALGTNTGNATASRPSTTAVATSTAHGFLENDSVTIAGATIGAFNITAAVHVISADQFSYTIASAQGATTGTITASSATGSTSSAMVIDWIRGTDNFQDENSNSSFTDTRASIHGDVLHSRPAVVNYNRRTDTGNLDNDVYIFYGGNDGVFRAVKGGFGSTAGDPDPGAEVWGLVAPEHFPYLARLRTNSPSISASFKKQYFFDGSIGTFSHDAAPADGKIDVSGTPDPADYTQDKVWLFLTMRRGGRSIYALDVSQPLTPRLLWRKGCPSFSTVSAEKDAATGCDLGWGELGQTWSEPKVIKQINCTASVCVGPTVDSDGNPVPDPVLMFGAGYDPTVEDFDPATVTASSASHVQSGGTSYSRTQGRGIYVVNARTGAIIWQASGHARTDGSTHAYKNVSGMDFAIPSDMAVVVGDPTTRPFRAYVGDTGANMWRVDFGDVNPANWTVAKLAAVGDQSTAAGRRKFQFAPDVIGASGYDMVVTGSGDREHPFDTTVTNRVYGFKDKRQTNPAFVSGSQVQPTITHADTYIYNTSIPALLNVTTNCIQVAANCSGTAPEVAVSGVSASLNTSGALASSGNEGWYIQLLLGEKQVGSTLAAGSGAVVFGTNQPSASAGGGATCAPNLGVARQYSVNFADGTAFSGTSLSTSYAGGGFLPSPVLVYVGLGGTSGTGTGTSGGVPVGGIVQGDQLKIGAGAGLGGGNDPTGVVCYGASCSLAPGKQLYSRLRKFWYKEID